MKNKEAKKIVKIIINRWQKSINFQKKNKNHYKLYRKTIDNQQNEVDALKQVLLKCIAYMDIIESMTSK